MSISCSEYTRNATVNVVTCLPLIGIFAVVGGMSSVEALALSVLENKKGDEINHLSDEDKAVYQVITDPNNPNAAKGRREIVSKYRTIALCSVIQGLLTIILAVALTALKIHPLWAGCVFGGIGLSLLSYGSYTVGKTNQYLRSN